MSDLVYKAERKRIAQDKLKQVRDNAVLTLRQYRFDESNADKFIDFVYKEVFDQVSTKEFRSISPASNMIPFDI